MRKQSFFKKNALGVFEGQFVTCDWDIIKTVEFAMNSYGFLINRNEQLTPIQFADRIRETYDCIQCAQNAAVVNSIEALL